jgi:hypothetical protein
MKLYPRYPGSSYDPDAKLRAKAHRLLDLAKAGQPIDEERITWALRILGDLE